MIFYHPSPGDKLELSTGTYFVEERLHGCCSPCIATREGQKMLLKMAWGKSTARMVFLEAFAQNRLGTFAGLPPEADVDLGERTHLARPYVPGETLAERLQREPYNPYELERAVKDVSLALAYCHGMGVLHRDVKLDNILLTNDTSRLLDFGLSRITVGSEVTDTQTPNGFVVGTPYYIPKEVWTKIAYSPKSDVYGFALSIYFALSEINPFYAEGNEEIARRHCCAEPPLLSTFLPVPLELDLLFADALSKDPQRRPTVLEFMERYSDAIA